MINNKSKGAFRIGAALLCLGFGFGLKACERDLESNITKSKPEPKRIEIKVGDYVYTDEGARSVAYCYNGMNNNSTFSLSGSGPGAVNVYYPASLKEIQFGGRRFNIIEVTPECIILDYLGKSKNR